MFLIHFPYKTFLKSASHPCHFGFSNSVFLLVIFSTPPPFRCHSSPGRLEHVSTARGYVVTMKSSHHLLVMIMVAVVSYMHGISCEFQRIDHPAKSDGSLSVLVIGDWGRKGHYNQSRLAQQMGIIAEKKNIDFVISTGDNFYPSGLINEHDPAFELSFTNAYTAPSLQRPWYSVLGNHDYRGNALAQLSPVLKQRDNKWFCQKSFILNSEIVDFFFIDTTPFQTKYFTEPEDHVYDWRGVLPRARYLSTILKDLDYALRESRAKWKVVVGHHTIKSAGIHGNTEELVHKVLPILKDNEVDLYINGHDHCLEHISSTDSPLQFVTSGGGSKAWRNYYDWSDVDEMKFYYDGQGFMSMQITTSNIDLNFYDISGKNLHKWSASKSHFSSI